MKNSFKRYLTLLGKSFNFAEASKQQGAAQQAPMQRRRSSGNYTLFQRLSFSPYKVVRLSTSVVVYHYLNGKIKPKIDRQTTDGLDKIVKFILKLT